MTTTTIEQFREQCAKTIELFDDATMRESDYMLDAHQCADIIRALPLPVMPEQAEPAGYQIRQVNYSGEEWQTPWTGATKQSCIDAGIEVRDLFAQDPSALLARIAELEAEIQKLKEGLKYYADGYHFTKTDEDAWDTVSGEPANFYEDENSTAIIEDGSIAKQVLAGNYKVLEDDET